VDTSTVVEMLGDGDAGRRRVAADALVAMGAEAVGPLVAAPCVKGCSPVGQAGVAVLHRIGEPAFWPLVAALATADDWSVERILGEALWGLRVPDRDCACLCCVTRAGIYATWPAGPSRAWAPRGSSTCPYCCPCSPTLSGTWPVALRAPLP
jgi:hypothetical protein